MFIESVNETDTEKTVLKDGFSHHVVLMPAELLNNCFVPGAAIEDDHEKFTRLAHDQWNGIEVCAGRFLYLFDKEPGFGKGYLVVDAEPALQTISENTMIRFVKSIDDFCDHGSVSPYHVSENDDGDGPEGSLDDLFSNIMSGFEVSEITLHAVGYLNGFDDEEFFIDDPKLFDAYARDQWKGTRAVKGRYLFDCGIYRGLVFEIVEALPEGLIGPDTKFTVRIDEPEKENVAESVDYKISFDDVIGQTAAKKKCRLIEHYLCDPGRFGKWAPRNVLFHGPSGTGKTMLAKALATKVNVPFFSIKSTNLIGEYVGEGARQIHDLYDKAEEMAPCIIFIDEIDAIALDRRYQELRGDVVEIVNALITEMDGLSERKGVCTIGSTNRLLSLDAAVRSRFEQEIEFVLPDENEIRQIIDTNLATFPIPADSLFDTRLFARKAKGLSGRDIAEKILKSAFHEAIIEEKETVPAAFFENALKELKKQNPVGDCQRLYV